MFKKQLAKERKGIQFSQAQDGSDRDSGSGSEEDREEDEDDDSEAEAEQTKPSRKRKRPSSRVDSAKELAKTVMDKKSARLYSRMQVCVNAPVLFAALRTAS